MRTKSKGTIRFWRFPELYNLKIVQGIKITHSFQRHIHQDFCIGMIEEGQRVCLHKGSKNLVNAGKIMIVNPGEAHTCESLGEHSYQMICCPISLLRLVLSQLSDKHQDNLFFPDLIIDDQELFQFLLHLCSILIESESTLEKESILLSTLVQLIIRHGRECSSLSALGDKREIIKLVKEYIENNFADDLSLEQLSYLAKLSPFHFLRIFSKEVGVSPHVYHTEIKIKQAKKLLLRGNSIVQVAYDVGFVDQSHFTRAFKKIVGVTPGEYLR